ncbi:hypothetical protein ACI79C_12165 [Geodermatophilus sp. SYSU D00697]
MSTPVLHLRGDVPSGLLDNAFLGQGDRLDIHVRHDDGSTEIYSYSRNHRTGLTSVRRSTNDVPFGCGCS